jgi:hypothetical protein
MIESLPRNQNLAFWLSPLAAALPLIPFFGLPSSSLFLGKLMAGGVNPFLWPGLGPWLAAMAVVFDATLLAYFIAALIYLPLFRPGPIRRRLFSGAGTHSWMRALIPFALAGIIASQLVHWGQDFREPALREFAVSWLSPLCGCLCGLASGACFVFFANRRFSPIARAVACSLPIVVVAACGSALIWSSTVMRGH